MINKKLFALALIALLSVSKEINRADAQVFILSDEEFQFAQRAQSGSGILPHLPDNDSTTDDYAPIDGGILLLGCLGGAYLLGHHHHRR